MGPREDDEIRRRSEVMANTVRPLGERPKPPEPDETQEEPRGELAARADHPTSLHERRRP
jgi:hypothetical protein